MFINGAGRRKRGEGEDFRYEVSEVRKWAQMLVRYVDSCGYVTLRAIKQKP